MQQTLSPEQQEAAFMYAAPVCILAGAGSGKTRVITHRIAHLVLNQGVKPYTILGVTFTNKAAREMRERVERLLPHQSKDILLGTFHGLAARFLRSYGDLVGVKRDFLIYDEDDASRLVKKIISERYQLDKDDLKDEVKKVLKRREYRDAHNQEDKAKYERVDSILALYEERLAKIGALDFSSLLYKLCELLEHEEGARIICARVRHVVVDEYQDINAIQSRIIHILVAQAETAAIVGDDDQSIYGWRGASASYMQKFLKSFNAKLIRLEENYRSTKPILDAANALIAHNQERLGKNLIAKNGTGPLLGLKQYFRDNQEAQAVIEQAKKLFEHYGPHFEIAVLMRTNAQSRPLEEALHKARMSYRMVGGMRFYDRKEIKDILAALRAVLYQQSDVDILRLLNSLPLGIGKKTQDNLSDYATSHNLSLYETMQVFDQERSQKKIAHLVQLLDRMRSELIQVAPDGEVKILRADEALIYVIDQFGIAAKLEQKHDDESEGRLENIEQLVQAAVAFVEDAEMRGEPADAQTFLENVSLISKDESVSEDRTANTGTITLMTLHAAKGLEFDSVFLVGLEEGVLPHSRSFPGSDEQKRKAALEEERRLLYVGMTRARQYLCLSFCQERFLHGKTTISEPSRFLRELPPEVFEPSARWILEQRSSARPQTLLRSVVSSASARPKAPTDAYRVEYDNAEKADSFIRVGARVYHENYATGTVLSLSGSGRAMRAQVRFEREKAVRTIMLSHLTPK